MSLFLEGDLAPRIPDADPLLVVAVVLTAGVILGTVARRFAKLPSITGQIVAGVVIGAYGMHLFGEEAVHSMAPITNFALGLVSVGVGSHLDLRRLRNAGRRLALLVAAEAVLVPVFVFAATRFVPGVTWSMSLLFGTIAISTAPATVLAIVKETRSRGVFVKTLLGAVALNNIACIFLFEVARELAHVELTGGVETALDGLIAPARQTLGAVLIGGAAAGFMNLMWRLVKRADLIATSALLAILLTCGISTELGVSPLLACLFLGIAQANTTRSREKRVAVVFETFQPAILAIFFTLAGMHLSFDKAAQAGMVAMGFFAGRVLGKLAATQIAMRVAGATERVRNNLGIALIPQAGVAIGLVLLIQDDPVFAEREQLVDLLIAVVLTVVTTSEILGPVLCRIALQRSGDYGMDRSRLFDFLQEENLVVGLDSRNKEDAIRTLVDRLIASQQLKDVDRDTLLESVMTRERQASTCLGGGLAVPHAILPEGREMVGVMGLSRAGLDFETPDKRPVHCMVLLATSESERDRHLQVLATLARVIGLDSAFQDRLYNSDSAGHAYEILHGEASVDFNTFLDADYEDGAAATRT